MASWNAQSVRNKTSNILDYTTEHDLDIFLITETWLFSDDYKSIGDMKPKGYDFCHVPRDDRQGGGIACIYKNGLNLTKLDAPYVTTMEIMELLLNVNSVKIRVITIYRPPPSEKKKYSMSSFYREFYELMAHYVLTTEDLIICGDLNFHVNNSSSEEAQKFMDILESFDLVQHIMEPTHRSGNALDLLITRTFTSLMHHDIDLQMSDHNVIVGHLHLHKLTCPTKTVNFRNFKSIEVFSIKNDIKVTMSNVHSSENLEYLVEDYYDILREILDKHAPEHCKEVAVRKPTPWMSQDIRPEKQKRRQLERRWRTTKLDSDYEAFKAQKNKINKILERDKSNFFTKLVHENKTDPKKLF